MQGRSKKILVVGPAWVGDMVMSQALYTHLHQSGAADTIDVLAPPWSAPLLARMPEVRKAIPMPLGHGELGLLSRRRLGRSLRKERYGQAIVLPNSWKSALVPLFADIPRRTGWRGEARHGLLNDLRYLDASALPLMVQRFVALGVDASEFGATTLPTPLPWPRLTTSEDETAACAQRFGIESAAPILALCPGAEFGPAKRWPAQHFAQVAATFLQRGWQVVLYGSEADRAICSQVIEGIKGGASKRSNMHNLAGRTALGEVVDLLSLSAAVLSNDSGLMHIAAALQRPVAAVFGATSPDFTPPLCTRVAIIRSKLDCAPCFERDCPLGHHGCMRDLEADIVVTKLDALLSAEALAGDNLKGQGP